MRWKQMDKWYIEQEGTGYKVSKGLFGVEGRVRYTAWAPKRDKYTPPELLDMTDTAEQAVEVCEEHRRNKQ